MRWYKKLPNTFQWYVHSGRCRGSHNLTTQVRKLSAGALPTAVRDHLELFEMRL